MRAVLFKPQHLGPETRPDDPSVIDGANATARVHFLLLKTKGALPRISPSHIKAANSKQASHVHTHTRSWPYFSISTRCWIKTRVHYRSWHKSIFLILIHPFFKTRAIVGSRSAIEIKSPFTIKQREALKKRCPRRTPAPSYDHLGSPGGEAKKATICDLVMLMPGPMMKQCARRNVNEALFNTGRTHNPKLGGGKSKKGTCTRSWRWDKEDKRGESVKIHWEDTEIILPCKRSWMRQTAVREHVDVLHQSSTKA